MRPVLPVPASIFDSAYVEFARGHLGPADDRALGQDARNLSMVLCDQPACTGVQPLCRLFEHVTRAMACAAVDVRALTEDQVDRPEHLPGLLRCEAASELLRCAALIEAPHYWRLPTVNADHQRLGAALAALVDVAPALSSKRVRSLRALGWHGRLWQDEIWVGVPGAMGVPLVHVAWQAAHEATLYDVSLAARGERSALSERRMESVALVLLAQRSRRCGQSPQHERWFDRFEQDRARMQPDCLARDERRLLDLCLG